MGIFRLTPNSLNTLDFALKKQSIRVFGKTHTHLYHSYTARSQLYVLVDGSERTKWLN